MSTRRKLGRLAALLIVEFFAIGSSSSARAREVRIAIEETRQGVRVVYDLPAAVTVLALGGEEVPPPDVSIRVEDPGLRYEAGAIRAATPFRRVSLVLQRDGGEVDSHYPLLLPISGRGFVLFAPYILPSSGAFRARVSVGHGQFRVLPRDEVTGGYVLVGTSPMERDGFRAVTSTSNTAALERTLHGRAAALLDYYRDRLRIRLHRKPVIVISFIEQVTEPTLLRFRGDVTPNGIVFLRFYGAPSDLTGSATTAQYTAFLAHELFHLWNGRRGGASDTEAWLHEGSAEYFSWFAVSVLWPEEASLDRNVDRAFQTCMAGLRSRSLTELNSAQARAVRYPCGVVVQWVADVGVRDSSHGHLDGLEIWARMLARSRPHAEYTVGDFRVATRELAPEAANMADALIDTQGPARWLDLAEVMRREGADVSIGPPTPFEIRTAAIRAIMLSACGEMWGIGEDSSGLFAMAPPSCERFPGTAFLLRIGGVDPLGDPEGLYAFVLAACAEQREIALVLRRDGVTGERNIRCTAGVESPLPDLRIRRALPNLVPADRGRSFPLKRLRHA